MLFELSHEVGDAPFGDDRQGCDAPRHQYVTGELPCYQQRSDGQPDRYEAVRKVAADVEMAVKWDGKR